MVHCLNGPVDLSSRLGVANGLVDETGGFSVHVPTDGHRLSFKLRSSSRHLGYLKECVGRTGERHRIIRGSVAVRLTFDLNRDSACTAVRVFCEHRVAQWVFTARPSAIVRMVRVARMRDANVELDGIVPIGPTSSDDGLMACEQAMEFG